MTPYNSISLTHYAATISKIIGMEPPALADTPLDWACDVMTDLCKEGYDRLFIHNPDAVGMWLWRKYPDAFFPVLKNTQLTIPFKTMMPSVTPVCFGTMYTGAEPAVHGIQKYEKPVIKIDTFFDAALRAGKKLALLATPSCSMANIFLERDFDLITCASEAEIVAKAKELIIKDEHDIIIVYTYLYDTLDHRCGPEAPESLDALYQQGIYFDTMVSCIRRNWKDHNTLIAFSPDHGVHKVLPEAPEYSSKGKLWMGGHGSDRPADLNILHYLGAVLKEKGEG